jgi:cell division protein FtsW (lipid II flippase)
MIRFRPYPRWIETRLILFPALLIVTGILSVSVADRDTFSLDQLLEFRTAAATAVLMIGASVVLSLGGIAGDQFVLPITAALCAFGYIMVERIGEALEANEPFYATLGRNHLIYLAGGFALLLFCAVTPFSLELLRRYKYTALAASLGLLLVTFVLGTSVGGARLWLELGPIRIQPSEIVKVTLVIFLAAYLSEKRDLIDASWRVGPFQLPPIPFLAPMVLMWAASLMVLVVLNDLGSALLFFGIFLVMIYAATGRSLYVIIGLVTFAIACWLAYRLFDRIEIRVQNWFDPWNDPLVNGYQPIQSDYALSAGGLLGTGLGQGQPWRIPAVHTDYVFSAIGEELGLLGTAGLLALYFVLVMRGMVISLRARSMFNRLFAAGLAATIGIQALIIIGGVLRVIPLTGITLPFVSSGGSSLLTNLLIVGLLLRVSHAEEVDA